MNLTCIRLGLTIFSWRLVVVQAYIGFVFAKKKNIINTQMTHCHRFLLLLLTGIENRLVKITVLFGCV